MKRRSIIKMIPLSIAGILGIPGITAPKTSKPLGMEYLSRIRDLLDKIKTTQSEELLEASYRIASVIKNGSKCYAVWDIGHSTEYDIWPDRPGNTDILTFGIPENPMTPGISGVIAFCRLGFRINCTIFIYK